MRMNLLRIDSAAALAAGALTALLASVLAGWYGLPLWLLQGFAAANLLYGLYSGWVALRPPPRPLAGIVLLVVANLVWTFICAALSLRFAHSATWLGLTHLIGEGLFVGALALSEWRQRRCLQTSA